MSSTHADASLTERGLAGMFLRHRQLTYKRMIDRFQKELVRTLKS